MAVTTAPAPALTPPPQYILHKNVQYPARDVKLPNGPDALVPIGFERWRVTPGGLRWPLRLNAVTGDIKRIDRPKKVRRNKIQTGAKCRSPK